ncbi:deoxyhypusine hydroxylase [Rhizophlyctis rosea]|uniref:Deoxyhypusine hydroxylase n=1 Tax=Rhizophlyctis rosea TaxID=64517 RepID=A0AAD5SHJ0_9FUNG|nr:deoxyhypusine hydroxylase [Rhizophlyctis rosea]
MTISVDAVDIVAAARNDPQTYARLEAELCNTDGTVPLHKRFRALFTLKSLADAPAVDIIDKAFVDPSALLKHELAYVLGQMRNPHALICLERVLRDQQEDPMVRHEAAEAIGAISKEDSLPLLEEYAKDDSRVVRETCELAIAKIKFEAKKAAGEESEDASAYTSVDPAPPVPKKAEKSTAQLREQLLDTTVSLFDRYRAMFALRNRGDVESVLALAEGLNDDSALFRHEIAYVFGQMQHPASVPALIKSLTNTTEEGMVRHECAEALGSIATPEVFPVLKQFATDENIVVRDSCIVGLDMFEHETSGEFQYADGLTAH